MLSLAEKKEMLEDGLNAARGQHFRRAHAPNKVGGISLDEYMNFLTGVNAFVSKVPADLIKPASMTYQL